MADVKQNSAARLTVQFLDFDDAPSAPSSATYAVFDKATGATIRASTALSPAASIDIMLNSIDTALIDSTNSREVHVVLVTGVYGANDEVHEVYEFVVVRVEWLQ